MAHFTSVDQMVEESILLPYIGIADSKCCCSVQALLFIITDLYNGSTLSLLCRRREDMKGLAGCHVSLQGLSWG